MGYHLKKTSCVVHMRNKKVPILTTYSFKKKKKLDSNSKKLEKIISYYLLKWNTLYIYIYFFYIGK